MSTPLPQKSAALEMASVLFMDIVGYSLEPMERQSELLQTLQSVVRGTAEFQQANEKNELISLPTGDGMALVFFSNPTVPVECALKVCRALKAQPQIRLRMGVHTGPVYRIADINANMNVSGGGINMAQRVMDCGDSGHILVSSAVAEVLSHLSGWPQYLKDLGEHPVKHGVKLHLYALCTDDVLNHEIPQKLRLKQLESLPPSKSKRTFILAASGVVAAIVVGAVVWKAVPHSSPASPVPTGAERELSYWITVQKYKDEKPYQEPFRLAGDINFEANYRIQLGFRSSQPGYLYLINEGPTPKNGLPDYHLLFPSPTANNGSARVEPNAEVLFPPVGKKFLRFDEQQGTEKFWIVWAKDDLPELAAAKQAASFRPEDGGSIQDSQRISALQQLLTKYSVEKPEATQDDTAKLTTLKVRGDVLVHARNLEHH